MYEDEMAYEPRYYGLPATRQTPVPELLDFEEDRFEYLSRILNAKVYEAAVETELQEAQNLSTVRRKIPSYLKHIPSHLLTLLRSLYLRH